MVIRLAAVCDIPAVFRIFKGDAFVVLQLLWKNWPVAGP
jgi:hypothetical protein